MVWKVSVYLRSLFLDVVQEKMFSVEKTSREHSRGSRKLFILEKP